jgi:outer membrane protein TolC
VARPGGLKAAEVAARAVETSLSLRQRTEDVNAASAQLGQATVAWFPRVVGTVRYARLSPIEDQTLGNVVVAPMAPLGPLGPGAVLVNAPVTIPSLQNQWAFQATLLLPVSEYLLRTPLAWGAAEDAKEAAALQRSATRLSVALDARLTYFNWARSHLQTVVAEQALIQAKAHRSSVGSLFDAGGASKADVLRVDAQVASAEVLLARAQAQETVLLEQVRTVMHDGGEAELEIGEDLTQPLAPSRPAGLKALLERATSRRLELKALEKTFAALGGQAKAARAGYLPRIDAVANATYANPNPRYFPPKDVAQGTWDVGVLLSYSPNEVALASQVTDGAVAKQRQSEVARDQFLDALRVEVAQAAVATTEADVSVDATRRGLAAAEESYRVRKELFVNERSTSTELTDAETNLTQARLNAVGARIDQRVARARLEHATGEDVEAP